MMRQGVKELLFIFLQNNVRCLKCISKIHQYLSCPKINLELFIRRFKIKYQRNIIHRDSFRVLIQCTNGLNIRRYFLFYLNLKLKFNTTLLFWFIPTSIICFLKSKKGLIFHWNSLSTIFHVFVLLFRKNKYKKLDVFVWTLV